MDRYNRQVAAARKAGFEITRRQQNELSSLLQDFADELGDRISSGFGTTNDVLLEREVRNLIGELHSGISGHILKNSRLQARTLAEMHARAHNEALGIAGLSGEAFENRMTGVSANLAQAVFARDGITDTYRTLNRGTAAQAQIILKRASIRGSSVDSVEKQMRLLVQGSESIPEELLVDRRLISKRTLTEYYGIDSPTNAEVAAVRRSARQVAGRSRLISRTSLMNVEQEATAIAMAESPIVEAGQWFLSSRHKDFDQCDVLATSDFYDIGDGVYPSDAVPSRPHPRCLCGVSHILRPVEEWGTKKKPGAPLHLNPKREAKRRGLKRSQSDSLRSVIGVGETRSGVAGRVRRNLPDKTAIIAYEALKSRARILRVLGTSRTDQLAKLNMLGGLARAGLIVRTIGAGASEYLALVGGSGAGAAAGGAGLVAMKRATRRRMVAKAPHVQQGASSPHTGRLADPDTGRLAHAKPPPVPPARDNLTRNLKDMEEWLANEANETLVAYTPEGKMSLMLPGDATSVPTPRTPIGYSMRGMTVTHNHPTWATDFRNAETFSNLPHSSGDLAFAAHFDLKEMRATTVFGTWSVKKRGKWNASWGELAPKSDAHKMFRWNFLDTNGNHLTDVLEAPWIQTLDRRWNTLGYRFDTHLRARGPKVPIGAPGAIGLDPGEWDFGDIGKLDRYFVYDSDDAMLAARAAGQIRAVTEHQFDEVVRTHLIRQLARENDWEFTFVPRKAPLTVPHRAQMTIAEYVAFNDNHSDLFVREIFSSISNPAVPFGFQAFKADPASPYAKSLASLLSVPHRSVRSRASSFALQEGRFAFRPERLKFIEELREKVYRSGFVAKLNRKDFTIELRISEDYVPQSLLRLKAWLSDPMRMKDAIDDLAISLGNVVRDRWVPPAAAFRSAVQRRFELLQRARFPGKRNSLDSFPELLLPETSDLPEGFTYNVKNTVRVKDLDTAVGIRKLHEDLVTIEILGPDGIRVAHVDLFADLKDVSFAGSIQVEEAFRRRGFGTALNVRVDELFPTLVDRGGTTPLGGLLRAARARNNVLDENLSLIDRWLTPQTHESMFILNSRGHPIAFRRGTTGSVPISVTDRVLMEGATVVHNHPAALGNMTFSFEDMNELTLGRAGGGVLLTRRYQYRLRPRSGKTFNPKSQLAGRTRHQTESEIFDEIFEDAMRDVFEENYVIPRNADRSDVPLRRRSAAMTLDEAEEAAQHIAVERYANKKGWDYTRVERRIPNLDAPVQPLDPVAAVEAARRVELNYDRAPVLMAKRDRLRELSDALEDVMGMGAEAQEISDRADVIDLLLMTSTETDIGHLNAPRWIRRGIDQATEDHSIAEVVMARLEAIVPDFLLDDKINATTMALRWRDKVEPKLRALGFPQRTFKLTSGLGTGERSYAPLASSRTLANAITDELGDTSALRTYAARYSDELDISRILEDIEELENNIDLEAISFGAGGENVPIGARMIAKHKVHRSAARRIVDQNDADGFIDFWIDVINEEIDQGSTRLQNVLDQLELGQPAIGARSRLMESGLGGVANDVTRENARTVLLKLADDIEDGLIPSLDTFANGDFVAAIGRDQEFIAPLLATIHRYRDSGRDMSAVAEAIRVEVQTLTAARKWRGHRVSIDAVSRRNAIEELVEALGDATDDVDFSDPSIVPFAIEELSEREVLRALQRAHIRTMDEVSLSGMIDNWAATSGKTPESVAFQLAVDVELGLDRASKKHLGLFSQPPQRKGSTNPLSSIIGRRKLALDAAIQDKVANELREELIEALIEEAERISQTGTATLALDTNFPLKFVERLADELNSGKRTVETLGAGIFIPDSDGLPGILSVYDLKDVTRGLRKIAAVGPAGDAMDAIGRAIREIGKEGIHPDVLSGVLGSVKNELSVAAKNLAIVRAASEKTSGVQAARRALARVERQFSVPLPAEFGAMKLRVDRLIAARDKAFLSLERMNQRLIDGWLNAWDPPSLLNERRFLMGDLEDIADLEKIAPSSRAAFEIDYPIGDGHIVRISPQSGRAGEPFIIQVTTLGGAVLEVPLEAKHLLGTRIARVFVDELDDAGANAILDVLRAHAFSDDATVRQALNALPFMQTDHIEGITGRIIAQRKILNVQIRAADSMGEFGSTRVTSTFKELWREKLDELEGYIARGVYDRDLGQSAIVADRRSLVRRIGDQVDRLQEKVDTFIEDNPQHAMFAVGDPEVLDIEEFKRLVAKAIADNDDAINIGTQIFERDERILRAAVREIYEQTQERLKFVGQRAPNIDVAKSYVVQRAREAGYAKVILENGEELIVDALAAARTDARVLTQTFVLPETDDVFRHRTGDWLDVMGAHDVRDVVKPLDEFVLWRGVGLPEDTLGKAFDANDRLGKVVTIRFQPLNSFSSSGVEAARFVGRNSEGGWIGAMHMVRVDRRKIFATPFTGPGCLCEHEFIVLGGALDTLTFSEPDFLMDFWDVLIRMRASGLVDDKEMAEWARYAGLTMLERDRVLPRISDLKGLGMQQGLVEDFFQEIDRAFDIDWDHLDEFVYDLSERRELVDEIVDKVLDSGKGEDYLMPSSLRRLYEVDDIPDLDPPELLEWLDENLGLQRLKDKIEIDIESFDFEDFQGADAVDLISAPFEQWYRETYFNEFVEEWVNSGKTGLVPTDPIDVEGALPFIGDPPEPDLTR